MVFDAPYNRQVNNPRLNNWQDWRKVLYPMLGKAYETISPSESQADLAFNIARGRATSDALLAGYQIPTMSMEPTGRPIGLLSLHRDTSYGSAYGSEGDVGGGSTGAGRSNIKRGTATEIQRDADMIQPCAEPLSPEDIATIKSGSVSQYNDDDDECDTTRNSDAAAAAGDADQMIQDQIDSRAAERSSAHRNKVGDEERKQAMESDVQDTEGLQLFRGAYQFWNRAMGRKPVQA